MKKIIILFIVVLIGCTQTNHDEMKYHATEENVADCFGHHPNEPFDDTLEHCKSDICISDTLCYEEVEQMAQKHRNP
jgi:hypothetical protein